MKVLITGANGMLAKAVINELKEEELILTDVADLDITNIDEVRKFVEENKPQYIINCAAYTAVDKAEEQEEIARKVGLGAIIFNDLSNSRIKDEIFDWDLILNFQGETRTLHTIYICKNKKYT